MPDVSDYVEFLIDQGMLQKFKDWHGDIEIYDEEYEEEPPPLCEVITPEEVLQFANELKIILPDSVIVNIPDLNLKVTGYIDDWSLEESGSYVYLFADDVEPIRTSGYFENLLSDCTIRDSIMSSSVLENADEVEQKRNEMCDLLNNLAKRIRKWVNDHDGDNGDMYDIIDMVQEKYLDIASPARRRGW